MSTCKICGHYSVFLQHICPPKFMVRGDEEDSYVLAIYTHVDCRAAREYVERMDSECAMEYTNYGKSSVRVIVTAPDGKITKFLVKAERTIEYHAYEVSDENSNMDSNVQSPGGVATAD